MTRAPDMAGARLPLHAHEHDCPRCRVRFRCTTPSCAGKTIKCVCCIATTIEARDRRRRELKFTSRRRRRR